jgi:hypothetical protein
VRDEGDAGGRLRVLAPLPVPAFALPWQALSFAGGARAPALVLVARFLLPSRAPPRSRPGSR